MIAIRQPVITNALYIFAALGLSLLIILLPPLISVAILLVTAIGISALLTPFVPLVILAILAPMRTLIATEAPGTFPVDIGQLMLLFLLVAWVANFLVNRRSLKSFPLSIVLIPVGLFTASVGLTAFSAVSFEAWLREFVKWVQIILLIMLITDLSSGFKWRWLVVGVIAAATANAVIGIYQFFGGSGALHLLVNGRYFRAFGTFGQPNPFGGFMGLSAPLAIMAAFSQLVALWNQWQRQNRFQTKTILLFLLYTVCAALIVMALGMSWSRGAWLGFATSLGTMTLLLPRKLWQSIALFSMGALLIITMWFAGLVPTAITNRLASINEELFTGADVRGVEITNANYAIVERLAHWQAAIRMAEANPWFGVGAGNYEVVYDHYQLINWEEPLGHAHNFYLNVLAEGGIMGLVSYLVMWLGIIVLTLQARGYPHPEARCLAIGLLGVWVYLSVHSLTDNLYVNNLFLHIGMMFGLLAALHRDVMNRVPLE